MSTNPCLSLGVGSRHPLREAWSYLGDSASGSPSQGYAAHISGPGFGEGLSGVAVGSVEAEMRPTGREVGPSSPVCQAEQGEACMVPERNPSCLELGLSSRRGAGPPVQPGQAGTTTQGSSLMSASCPGAPALAPGLRERSHLHHKLGFGLQVMCLFVTSYYN